MNHDQLALYNKLLVLYMLNRSAFPLTQAQIYDFLLPALPEAVLSL